MRQIYVEFTCAGTKIGDDEVNYCVNAWIDAFHEGEDISILTRNELVVLAFMLAVKEGKIKGDELCIDESYFDKTAESPLWNILSGLNLNKGWKK